MWESAKAFIEDEAPLIADLLVPEIRPCVLADSSPVAENDLPVGASKFCGRPDVPPSFEWPTTEDGPCWFLGQINLSEFQPFETGVEAPDHGLLSFFYHDAGGPAGAQSRMMYLPAENLERIEIVPDTRWGEDFYDRHLYPRSLNFSQGYSLPEVEALERSSTRLAEDDDLFDLVWSFKDEFSTARHQFFGLRGDASTRGPKGCQLIAMFGECQDQIVYYIPNSDVPELRDEGLTVIYEHT